jgi:pSer/pThr/pTyr-binding forkhead associated (FHA) protein
MGEYYSLVDSEGKETEVQVEIKVGRANTNDIVIEDTLISRHHAILFLEDDALFVRDERSVNGTLVNGKRIYEPTRLKDRDQLQFGEAIMIVKAPIAQAETVLSVEPGGEESLSTVLKSPDKDFDSTIVSDQNSLENEMIPSEKNQASNVSRDAAKGSDKKVNRLNIAILILVIVMLCVCCISIILIYFFVVRDSSIIFTPENFPFDSLSGMVL